MLRKTFRHGRALLSLIFVIQCLSSSVQVKFQGFGGRERGSYILGSGALI